ncbi:hypothetical protein ASG67_04130 [Sphingomonas sp. Leaf339]|uniref:hypothetical protein n=1 Tax=Sphingomonas sp. Leaf339 TaxID=1736343 RepID=UPI0006F26918|nr:hypothetical protein [Sphingomonas sp. Leaf339]KQU62293.1 hypothetical protein ASG67_04130 [Sphingomonas sp. Leaf339]
MKLTTLFAAGLVVLSGLAPMAPAAAQRTVVHDRTVVRHDGGRHYRGRDRVRTRRVCTNRWRDGRRVQVCRTVRVRR